MHICDEIEIEEEGSGTSVRTAARYWSTYLRLDRDRGGEARNLGEDSGEVLDDDGEVDLKYIESI